MNSDGSGQTRLTYSTSAPSSTYNNHPSWSADGNTITFASTRNNANTYTYQFFVMNADGSNQTLINNLPTSQEPDPDCRRCARFNIPAP